MHVLNKLDFPQIDYRSLPPEKRQVLTLARNAIRDLAINVAAALGCWRRAQADRRRRRRAMAQLRALSDLELKDIGVYRCEIPWVVNHGRHTQPANMVGKGRPDLRPDAMSASPFTTASCHTV